MLYTNALHLDVTPPFQQNEKDEINFGQEMLTIQPLCERLIVMPLEKAGNFFSSLLTLMSTWVHATSAVTMF